MKRVEFASLLVMVVMVPRRRVCVETMRNIIMQIMIHRSEYLHLHSCVRAPFPGSSVFALSLSRSLSHTRPLPRSFFSLFSVSYRSVVRLRQIAELGGGGREGGREGF